MNYINIKDKKIFPSKVVCIGRNYIEHIQELNNEVPSEMVFFNKPNSSISQTLEFPSNFSSCHYEAELSFLIKNDEIYAVGFGLDLTLREIQKELKTKGLPWERAKSFNKSAVFSDFVLFDKDVKELKLELYINGELKQCAKYSLMINKIDEIINEFKTFSSFEDDDILMTGTPKGVGKFYKDDVFVGKVLYQNEILIEKTFKVI